MPILEVDGKTCVQTGAIARYCGKQSGFYPRDDDWAAAKIDEIIDTATDITVSVGKTFGMEAAAKAVARAELAATTLPKYLTALEKIMSENGSTGFYVGNKMTIADLAMWRMWGWIAGGIVDGIPTDLLDAYPQVKKLRGNWSSPRSGCLDGQVQEMRIFAFEIQNLPGWQNARNYIFC